MGSKDKGLARNASFVGMAILASRLLGFVRERAVAEVFGRTAVTDAFYAAFAIPDLMYVLLVGGALSAAFIPVFKEYLSLGKEDEAWHIASSFINLTILGLLAFSVFGIVFAPWLAPLVAHGFEGEQLTLLVALTRIMFPAVFFTALAGLSRGVLNSYQSFTIPAIGPIIYNLGMIVGAYMLGRRYGIAGMALGVVFGALANFAVQAPSVMKRARYRLKIDLSHPGIRKLGRLMLPALFGLSVHQLNLIVNQNFASALTDGSISALRYANRLMQLPLGVFAMAVSTVSFPTLIEQASRKEDRAFRWTVSSTLRSVFFVTIPAAVGLIVLAQPIVRLLFEVGQFGPADTQATAVALAYYSLGLVSQSGVQLMTFMYYSLNDTLTPVKTAIFALILNALLNLFFLRFTPMAHGGLALAYALTSVVNMAILMAVLRRKIGGMDGRRVAISCAKAFVAALAMGLVAWVMARWAPGVFSIESKTGQLVQVGIAIGAGALVYGLVSILLKADELQFVIGRLPGLRGR